MAKKRKIDTVSVLARIKRDGPSTELTLGEAAAVLTRLREIPVGEARLAQAMLRTELVRASEPEKPRAITPRLSALPSGNVHAGELSRWATVRFGRQFPELPRGAPRVVLLAAAGVVSAASAEADLFVVPGSADARLTLILELEAQRRQLEGEKLSADQQRKLKLRDRLRAKKMTSRTHLPR